MPRALFDGLYEHLLTSGLTHDLEALEQLRRRDFVPLDSSDAHHVLARHFMKELAGVLGAVPPAERPQRQIAIVNHLLNELKSFDPDAAEGIEDAAIVEPRQLAAIYREDVPPKRPHTPLTTSTLLTRNPDEPNLALALAREIESADRIDLIVAFISMSGLRAIRTALDDFDRRVGHAPERMRILTTVFQGVTEAAAIDTLARLPSARVKVSYDVERTRLHAKAWLMHRNTGLHTAYVGSANLTSTALGSGQEWMVKIAASDLRHVIDSFTGTFDTLWHDSEFETYDPQSDASRDRLLAALKQERASKQVAPVLQFFTLRPFPFQQEILDRLETERVVHGRMRNLVVAATGTGKTVIAAFDYARQAERMGNKPRLLFLAHRKELLQQACGTFRQVLRDASFGELAVDGEVPARWDHVFASIQSASRQQLVERFGAEHFHFVVVDECHHVPADSYQAVVPHLRPHILLGLTATPERSDGKSLLHDFDGHIAAELRIWHALERQMLVPFEYYGISDDVDLKSVRMSRSGYEATELSRVYTGHHARADLIAKNLLERVSSLSEVRALAFCVSIEHAEFMAKALTERAIPSMAVHGRTPPEVRSDAPRRLQAGEVKVLCTCDLYNEGVDLPCVDTLLLLRPTSSATVFLQQLGRGLRRNKGKVSCLVLDFIGAHRTEFRFDEVLGALTNTPRSKLAGAIEEGFPFLPSGCVLQLDPRAQRQILDAVRAQLGGRTRMVAELRAQVRVDSPPTLSSYLTESGRTLEEVYAGRGSWTSLRRAAGLLPNVDPDADEVGSRLGQLLHVDEMARLNALTARPSSAPSQLEERRYAMLATQLERFGVVKTAEQVATYLSKHAAVREESAELSQVLGDRIALAHDVYPIAEWPLALHRHYRSREILAAIGRVRAGEKNPGLMKGVFKVPDRDQELLFITLDKSDHAFSVTTRYRDYAMSSELFHWETPSQASVARPSGRRYIESATNGWSFFLFVRTDKDAPYAFLGPAHYVSHEGDRPIAITWRLEHPLPAALYQRYATLAQG